MQPVFVGYRFPPSDALARQAILREIRNGTPRVVTVLGPSSPDAGRMEALLNAAMNGSYAPEAQPLFAEDFLSLYQHLNLV